MGEQAIFDDDDSKYICLRCRETGHIFNDCPNEWFTEVWITSQPRKEMYYGYLPELVDEPLCQRCQDLDILKYLHQELPWTSMLHLDDDTVRKSGCLKSIGDVGTIIFRDDCQLCRCLYTMTPEPEKEDESVMLFPSWTMCRLEGGISIDTPEKQKYARTLQVVLDPDSNMQLSDTAQRGDALCLLNEDLIDPHTCLGGRCIDPTQMDFEIIDRWISTCASLHPITCASRWSEELQTISLIDVYSRQLVKHPPQKTEYLALSYVWGGVSQGHYRLGAKLGSLPQTIEDAITFSLRLGKQYLWVDSICIDQSDGVEKLRQIRMMSLIYEAADATIIAFSGESAISGLPRISAEEPLTPQMRCCIDGKRFVGTMPTLSQSVWISSWGDRAWTMQEALLSRRCLYLGQDQVIFECNAMQCSEALDESKSWVHQTQRTEKFIAGRGHSEALVGAGVLRNTFVADQHKNDRLQQYTVLANLYSFRQMSYEDDAINGFSGIIQNLTRLAYPRGFFYGLPLEDLNWALLWNFQSDLVRRSNFPTWSWAGWDTKLVEMQPIEVTKPHYYQVFLKIWKLESDRLVLLLDLPPKSAPGIEDELAKLSVKDRLPKLISAPSNPSEFSFTAVPKADLGRSLFIEGLIVKFKPYYKQPRITSSAWGDYSYFDLKLGGVRCMLKVINSDAILTDKTYKKYLRCLLLARDQDEDDNHYHLLVLKGNGPVVSRQSIITIQADRTEDDLLNHVDVEKQRIVLR